MAESKKEKSYLIWMLKIIATIMVIYIHSANIFGYSNTTIPDYLRPFSLLSNTGVPLFMLISGYLFFRREVDWKENLRKKVKRLAIPFLIWSGFWILFEFAGYLIFPSRFENVLGWNLADFLYNWIGIPFTAGPLYGPLWYVRDLFIISIFAPFVQRLIRKYPIAFFILAVVFWFVPINRMFRQTVVLFVIGGVFSIQSDWIEAFKRIDYKIGFITLSAAIAASFVKIDCMYQLTIFLYTATAFLICNGLLHNKHVKSVCKYLAAYVFIIYVLHGKPLSIMQILYTSLLTGKGWVLLGYFILPLICFFAFLGVAIVFKKYLPRAYKICTGE